MQRMGMSIRSLGRMYNLLWIFFLLLYSAAILVFLILGISTPSLFILPFCLFLPGYAFVAVFFPRSSNLEKVLMSIAFSMALFVGIKSFIRTFAFKGLFSELSFVTIFSIICLITKLVIVIKSGKS